MSRRADAPRLAALALLACGLLCVCTTRDAGADVRFGDSAWVAPAWPIDGDAAKDGPRVAAPDHERRWETALRLPFRMVFLPVRLVGAGLEAGAAYLGPRYFEPKSRRPPKPGPTFAPYVTYGALNDIGVGPALNWVGFPVAAGKLHLAGSWSPIDHRRVHFSETIGERRTLGFRVRADYESRPNRRYFGIGNATPESSLSYYRLGNLGAEAALLVGASPLRQLRFVGGYSSMSPGRGSHGTPLLEDVFAPDSVPFGRQSTRELWYGVTADLAALDDDRDPSFGVHGRVDLRRAAGMRSDDPDYDQWRIEGRAYLPVFAKRRVIAVRAVYAGVDPATGTESLPFYRLMQSEGATRFAGFTAERFHDRQLALARIEYRWLILHRMSAVGLYELGAVAPERASFRLDTAHRAYGAGVRIGISNVSTLRAEVVKSDEGYHSTLTIGGDF